MAALLLLAAGALLAALILAPWPSRRTAIEPPAPDLTRVEPALAGKIRAATAELRRAPGAVERWGRLGIIFDIHDLLPEAVACYERAQTLDPGDYRWPYFLGICTMASDQRAALDHFRRAAELNPDYAPIHVYRGRGRLLTEELAAAETAFRRAATLDPDLIRAHLGLAKVALARGDAGAALASLERARELGPRTGEVHRLLAAAHRGLGDLDAAAEQARLAARGGKLEPLADPVRDALGWSEGVTFRWRKVRSDRHLRRGEVQRAIAEWQAALTEDPRSVAALLELATILTGIGRLDQAVEHGRRAVELEPGHARAHLNLGNALARRGDTEQGVAAFERALELDPRLHEARGNLGSLLVTRGRTEAGLAHLRQASAAMPQNADAHFNLAMTLRGTGRRQEAVEVFDRALAADAGHLPARLERGVTLAEAGRLREAAADFRAVAEADTTRASAHVNLVRALLEEDRFAEAIAACRTGLAQVPAAAAGHGRLADYLAWMLATCPEERQRDGREALAVARALCEQTGYGVPRLLETLAAACAETGDFDAAVRHATSALALVRERQPRDAAALERIEAERRLYRRRQPFRDHR